MASYNRVIMIGRLVRDPEKRYTPSGLALTTFSIAVDRPFKDQSTGERKTDFFRCKAWRQKAEFVADYLQKGRLVAVEGRLETSESVGQDGQKRYYTDIVCDTVESLDSPRDAAGPAASDNFGGGSQNFEDDGYDEASVAPQRAPQRPVQAAAPARQAPQRPAPPQRPAARPAPARAPEPAYPDDDYDDSDPFADE
jgi:single-strand DNA-binding protein